MMDALEISTFGEPSDVVELVTISDPDAPIANEVLVAVEYAPIDNADFRTIRGQYGTLPSLPTGLGIEGVGRILSVGEEVDQLKVGARVLLPSSHHSSPERLVWSSTDLFRLPPGARLLTLVRLGHPPPTLVP